MSITIPSEKLAIYNDFGALNITKPFQPFGHITLKNSRFIVGSRMFLGKKIAELTISLTWNDLPADFSAYYAAYKQLNYSFDDQCFRISASILHKGKWVNLMVLPDNRLFKSNVNGTLSKISSFSLQPQNGIIAMPNSNGSEPFKYTEKSSDGFLKIQLIAPQDGFGSSIYSNVVTEIVFKNASGHNIPLPNPPFVPTAQSITVNFC
jgi:hypothetical protein